MSFKDITWSDRLNLGINVLATGIRAVLSIIFHPIGWIIGCIYDDIKSGWRSAVDG